MATSLVPISELPSSGEADNFVDSPIVWDVEPGPYVEHERIYLDTARTDRLLKVAGFSGLRVRQYTSELNDLQSGIIGIGSIGLDGTIVATGSKVGSRQQLSKSNFMFWDEERGLPLECKRPGLNVDIDRAETGAMVSDYVQDGMSREHAWSKVYDRALRQGIMQGAKKFNVELPFTNLNVSVMSSMPFVGAGMALANTLLSGPEVGAPMWAMYYAWHVGYVSVMSKGTAGESGLRSRRWAVMPAAFQPERYGWAAVRAASTRLIVAKEA